MASNVATAAPDEPRDDDDREKGGRKNRAIKSTALDKPTSPTGGGSTARAGGFFTIHKKGQGYWTRMGTALGAALLGVLTSYTIYEHHPRFRAEPRIAIAIAAGFFAIFALIVWRLINKPANVDFLIATDSEMKKVNWTSRKDLIGSTKVVILFMFMIALILFVIDLVFWVLFYWMGVLKFLPFGDGK